MIRPRRTRGDARRRGGAILLTAGLLLTARAGLEALPLPEFRSNRALVRELDPLVFARFSAPDRVDDARPDVDELPIEEARDRTDLDVDVLLAVEELTRRFADPASLSAPERRVDSESGVSGIASADDDVFESLFGGDAAADLTTPIARRRVAGRSPPTTTSPGIRLRMDGPSASATGDASAPRVEAPVAEVESRDRTPSEGIEVVVRDFEPEQFGGTQVERLRTWIEAHHEELPVGVRMHLRYQPTLPTASVRFSSAGRALELYLMFNPSLRELHILLVEGERSVYLIDRGFQEQSTSLREGTVRRSGDAIVAVDSSPGAASSERAREFYDLFLSWWSGVTSDGDAS